MQSDQHPFPDTFSPVFPLHCEKAMNGWCWSLFCLGIYRYIGGSFGIHRYIATENWCADTPLTLIPQPFSRTPLHRQLIRQHGNEFPIRRLILRRTNPAPKRRIQRLNPSSVPRHLNRMPYRPLHLGGAQGGAARLLGIQQQTPLSLQRQTLYCSFTMIVYHVFTGVLVYKIQFRLYSI